MKCKKCGCTDLRVIWTRARGESVVRQRRCRHCGTEKRTIEAVEREDISTISEKVT